MQSVPNCISDEARADPAVRQIQVTHYAQKTPAERVETQNRAYLIFCAHLLKFNNILGGMECLPPFDPIDPPLRYR
mgnify:CR=1 FL=1